MNHPALLNLYAYTYIQLSIWLLSGINSFLSINHKPILSWLTKYNHSADINTSLII